MILYRVELHLVDELNRDPDSITYVKARSRDHAYLVAAMLPGSWKAVVIR